MKKINSLIFFCLCCLLGYFVGCNDPYEGSDFAVVEGVTAGAYIENDENFELWETLLKRANVFDAITMDGTYTCFVPQNEAVTKYLSKKGFGSIDQVTVEDASNIVKYHIIASSAFKHETFAQGTIPDTTASGDYLTTQYVPNQGNSVYVNEYALIIERDIEVINGYIHVLNEVLDPITESIYEKLEAESERYSIMLEAMKLTGYDKSLNTIKNDEGIRQSMTLMAVSDSVFNIHNITSIEDLKTLVFNIDDNFEQASNRLNKYVGYHVIRGVQSFADLAEFPGEDKKKNVVTCASNELFTIEDINGELIINRDEDLETSIRLLETRMNNQAKNGIYHEVDHVMPVYSPAPTLIKFEFTDAAHFPKFAEFEYYHRGRSAGQGKTHYLEPGMIPEIRWLAIPEESGKVRYETRGTWVNYFDNADVLTANLGLVGWVEIDIPPVVKGKYRLKLHHMYAKSRGTYQVSIDGKKLGAPLVCYYNGYSKRLSDLGVVNFRQTQGHTIRFSVVSRGNIEMDYLILEPIND